MPRLSRPGQSVKTLPASPAGTTKNLTVLALRVAFTPDKDLATTGDGTFLMDIDSLDIESVQCDGFLVDRPPHNAPYFRAQLEAVANYFAAVTDSNVTFDLAGSLIYPDAGAGPIELGKCMADYRPVDEDSSDALLVKLFAESVAAAAESGIPVASYNLVVVFHAGLGQDFAYYGLDPTPRDIPSAYIDPEMIHNALGTPGIPLPPDSTSFVSGGILLPEGQNHIYYDIVADVFPGGDDYCDVQIGLTGTFALLTGYALGFPPLFDTDDGETGVGVFGLMDVGSGNGQGVIPAPPTAWTRTYLGWEQAEELEGDFALAARHLDEGQIGRITLSTDEYLLVENRLNWIPDLPSVDLDSLRYRDRDVTGSGGYVLPPYFDYLVDSVGVDTSGGVITSVPNYDLGLPGSGLLIWHVDESRCNATMQGINDNPEARAVALVEADGAMDIGFPTTALFADPTKGWRWDMWYAGNEAFFMANPDREANNPGSLLSFDSNTRPSTHLNSGAESGIAVSRIGPAGDVLDFVVGDVNLTRLPEGSRLLGFNGTTWVYEWGDSLWLGNVPFDRRTSGAKQTLMVSEHDSPTPFIWAIPYTPGFWILDKTETGYRARRFLHDGTSHIDKDDEVAYEEAYSDVGRLFIGVRDSVLPESPDTTYLEYYQMHYEQGFLVITSWGYLMDNKTRSPVITGTIPQSLGDVDGDGLDEIVAFTFRSDIKESMPTYRMTVVDSNGTVLDGFPVHGNFIPSPVLIANLEGDIRPELVVVESGDIAIYGPEGAEQLRLGLHAEPDELFLMHFPPDSVGLANGDRIHWFEPKEQNPQWVTPQGRHSRSRYSLNDGIVKVDQPTVLDQSRAYNYPNPVTDGRTTIRFYTGSAIRAAIQVFTVDGLPVARTEMTGLAVNDYNEWVWEVGDNPSGLYYAVVEVEGSEKVSALVKIAVVW